MQMFYKSAWVEFHPVGVVSSFCLSRKNAYEARFSR